MPVTQQLPYPELLKQASSYVRRIDMLQVSYRDGYEQRAEDGINARRTGWSLVWIPLIETKKDDIEAFWEEYTTCETWLWTPPGSTTEMVWRFEDGLSYNQRRRELYYFCTC